MYVPSNSTVVPSVLSLPRGSAPFSGSISRKFALVRYSALESTGDQPGLNSLLYLNLSISLLVSPPCRQIVPILDGV